MLKEAGQFKVVKISILSDESICEYGGLFLKKQIPIMSKAKTSYLGKPFYRIENGMCNGVDEKGDPINAPDVDAKLNAIGQERYWKFLGKRELGVLETLFMMAAGYGILSLVLQMWDTAWGKVGQ